MRHKVFSVYDSKAEAYLQPFFSITAGQATRSFSDACLDQNHQFHKHAGDYTLFEIGTYEDETGIMLAHQSKINLGTALEYLAKANVREVRQGDLPFVERGVVTAARKETA